MPCIVLKHAKGVKCYISSEDVMTITYKIGNILKTFWASFSPFSIRILSTGQKGVSTVAIFAIVATLSRQSVDNSSTSQYRPANPELIVYISNQGITGGDWQKLAFTYSISRQYGFISYRYVLRCTRWFCF